jgi:hypothetical protein
MHALRSARLPARAATAAVVAGLALAGCAGSGLAAVQAPAGLIPAHQRPEPTGPAAAQIARFRWSDLPASPLGPRSQPLLAWTGQDLLELGGLKGLNGTTTADDGAAFNLATGKWHRIETPPCRVALANAVSVWTGRQLLVASGQSGSCPAGEKAKPNAGLYDPATNRWSLTGLPAQLIGLDLAAAVWTGRDVIVAGVDTSHGRLGVAAYDPAVGTWQVITPALPAHHPPRSVALVATADRLILWSLWDRVTTYQNGLSDYAGVDVLAVSPGGAWRNVTGQWPQNQLVTSPIFTGTALLFEPNQIWCGTACSPPFGENPGYFADPATLTRTTIPLGPLGQANPAFIWTGRAIIAVNLDASITGPGGQRPIRPDDTALWDPATRQWRALPAPPGSPVLSAVPVWAGPQLLALAATGQLVALHR